MDAAIEVNGWSKASGSNSSSTQRRSVVVSCADVDSLRSWNRRRRRVRETALADPILRRENPGSVSAVTTRPCEPRLRPDMHRNASFFENARTDADFRLRFGYRAKKDSRWDLNFAREKKGFFSGLSFSLCILRNAMATSRIIYDLMM